MTTGTPNQMNDRFNDDELLMEQIRKPDSIEQAEYIAVSKRIEELLRTGEIEPSQAAAAYSAHLKMDEYTPIAELTEAMIASFEADKNIYNQLKQVQLAAKIEYQGGPNLEDHANAISNMHKAYEPPSPLSPDTKHEAARIIALHHRAKKLAASLPPGFDISNLEGIQSKGPGDFGAELHTTPSTKNPAHVVHASQADLERLHGADDRHANCAATRAL